MREILMYMCSQGAANSIRLCGEWWTAEHYPFGVGTSNGAVDFFQLIDRRLNRSLKNQFFSIFEIFDHV